MAKGSRSNSQSRSTPVAEISGRTNLAAALGKSINTVRKWIADGLPERDGAVFWLPDVIAWLIDREVGRHAPQDGSKTARAELERRKLEAETKLKEFEARLREGDYLEADEVRRMFQQRIQLISDGLEWLAAELPERYQSHLTRLRNAYAAGDVADLLKEQKRAASGGGGARKGRGRPRKKR